MTASDQPARERPRLRTRLSTPLAEFLRLEAAGGIVLVAATVLALLWANSPWQDSYTTLWNTDLSITLGSHSIDLTLQEWINDGLMAFFFFVVGLEIKRELVTGELRDPRRATLPAIAALGGMVVPALIYLAINAGGPGVHGWGIPMATDIAMAVGVVSLLGARVAPSLKVFLLALAIVDDIGAIAVIAIFYSDDLHIGSLGTAALVLAAVYVLVSIGVRFVPVYIVLGTLAWLLVHEAGIHATLAGVILGFMTPTSPVHQPDDVSDDDLLDISTPEAARRTAVLAKGAVSPAAWLEYVLHPWTSFVIVPLFALANAGIPLTASALADAASSRITYGVVAGLVVGKLAGITAFSWLGVRLRIGALPEGASWRAMAGMAAVAGIGFTVAIFVSGLAFTDADLQDQAKIGILVASVVAGALGALVLTRAHARSGDPPGPARPGPR